MGQHRPGCQEQVRTDGAHSLAMLTRPAWCLSFPHRNQAMRKKLILYFKRRNHARKQWVSPPRGPHPGTSSWPLWTGLESSRPARTLQFCSCLIPACPGCEEKPRPAGQMGGASSGSVKPGARAWLLQGGLGVAGPRPLPLPFQPGWGEGRRWLGKWVPRQRTCWALIGRKRGLL